MDMEWKKNDRIELEIEDLGSEGEGIGRFCGFTWFVKDAVIGDRVSARIIKVKKSYGYARLEEILAPSPFRVLPRCSVARQCGGCQLQALNYAEQLHFKERKVYNNLRRIGGFSDLVFLPAIGMEEPWRYRNKVQFPFSLSRDGRIVTGFYAAHSHTVIENEDCILGVEENEKILSCIRRHMEEYRLAPYDERSHTGFLRHVLLRKGFSTGEIMVCLVINGSVEGLKSPRTLAECLCGLFDGQGEWADDPKPHITSISCSINTERTNVIMGSRIENIYGPGYITDSIGTVKYRISPLSFYQVNPVQTERLYRAASDFAGLTGEEIVMDLYCGIGAISLFMAQKARWIYGIESVPQAIEDARANAALNHISNAEFFAGEAEKLLVCLYEERNIHADVVIVDPPRKGCAKACLDTILKISPERIVYVSCDSATLARDLRHLCDGGYRLDKVQVVDMFPQTVDVETVCALSRIK